MTQPPNLYRKVRVLLVEDDLADASLTSEVFKETRFPLELTRVSDGDEAMAFLRKQGEFADAARPDVILLDLNMPRKDGHVTLEEIRRIPELAQTPVLIFTCSKNEKDIRRAYEEKANFYLVKPSDLDHLFETIRYVEDVWLSPFAFESALGA